MQSTHVDVSIHVVRVLGEERARPVTGGSRCCLGYPEGSIAVNAFLGPWSTVRTRHVFMGLRAETRACKSLAEIQLRGQGPAGRPLGAVAAGVDRLACRVRMYQGSRRAGAIAGAQERGCDRSSPLEMPRSTRREPAPAPGLRPRGRGHRGRLRHHRDSAALLQACALDQKSRLHRCAFPTVALSARRPCACLT